MFMIPNLTEYLKNLTRRDIHPEVFTVFPFPGDYTVLQILQSIGFKLDNLWGGLKINATANTVNYDTPASVSVSGTADDLNLIFNIPRGETGLTGAAGPRGPEGVPGPEGPQGPQGPAYELTSDDKSSIVQDVLAALPVYNGEVQNIG